MERNRDPKTWAALNQVLGHCIIVFRLSCARNWATSENPPTFLCPSFWAHILHYCHGYTKIISTLCPDIISTDQPKFQNRCLSKAQGNKVFSFSLSISSSRVGTSWGLSPDASPDSLKCYNVTPLDVTNGEQCANIVTPI